MRTRTIPVRRKKKKKTIIRCKHCHGIIEDLALMFVHEPRCTKNPLCTAKFKEGDTVVIVKYGHLLISHRSKYKLFSEKEPYWKDGDVMAFDLHPELVGQIGFVDGRTVTQGKVEYSLSGIKGKCSWYSENQLDFYNKNNLHN